MKRRQRTKRLRAFIAILCSFALVVMPVMPAWGDTTSGDMVATGQATENVDLGNSKTAKRIQSFTLDNTFSYQSLGNDPNKPTLTLSTSALQSIVKDKLLPQWSGLAASVFRDQAGQLVDLYGYQPSGGNMSQAGFDAYFNMSGSGNVKYKDEVWSCYNLKHKLGQTWATHSGDPGWDQFTVSGVKQVSDLNDVRNMVGQALYDCQGHKGLKAEEFINVREDGNERLDALKDHPTNGFANLVTSVNCKGASSDFDYVSFGIVFYDFEPVPVAAQGLAYQSGALKTETKQKGNNDSTITNGQQQDIVHSAALGDSVTETTSTTLSGLASYKLSENIGAGIGMSTTESESSTDFWADDEGSGAETSTSSETFSMGLNWGAAWEMAGALGAEAGHSKSEQVSKAVETTIAIPPHTAATIESNTTTTTYTQNYQQPVILNYKVALFAVSGDYYTGGDGGINPSSYEKQSLVIKFDTKGESNPSYGCAATNDLYSRMVTNKDVANYDIANGRTYSTHSSVSGWTKSEDINWDSVKGIAQSYYSDDVENGVAKKNFFYETLGKLSVEQDKTTSSVQSTYPMYNLASVKTPKTNYVLFTNSSLNSSSLSVDGYNKDGVRFYGFDTNQGYGQWKLCDADGQNVYDFPKEGDPVVYDDNAEALKPKTGTQGGTIYLTWVFNPGATPKTGESPNGQNLIQDQAAGKIATPVVRIDVKDVGLENPKITAEGSYTGYYGTSVNLNNVMKYEVTDSNDKIIEPQVKWESREPSNYGINVNADTGNVTFTNHGTYLVRPYVIKNSGDPVYPKTSDGQWVWLTVTAIEHNLVHQDAQDATCTADGWIEHYRCSDCGKYFSDIAGQNELSESDVVIKATGHDWGDWTTTQEISGDTPGKQQRVCKNDAKHVEERDVYKVQFNMNGRAGSAPQEQTFTSDVRSSVTIPQEPKAAGYTFEGWYKDAACKETYDFGSTVDSNLTLYAKWSRTKYTVASTAIVYIAGSDGEQKILPAKDCYVSVKANDVNGQSIRDEEGYNYSYMDVKPGDTVTLTVNPGSDGKYTFTDSAENIQAVQVNSNLSTASADLSATNSVPLEKTGVKTYTFTMPAADVAVVANVNQNKVTVTYDENKPTGANGNVQELPDTKSVTQDKGSLFTPVTVDSQLTVPASTEGGAPTTFNFGGWYTDKACTQPFLSGSKVTQDITLFAKWAIIENPHEVSYTLLYPEGASEKVGYKVENGASAYDPTNDLYALVSSEDLAKYDLQKASNGSSWYTDKACTDETAYDFNTSSVTDNLTLYAKVVPRKYTVSYFDGAKQLGTQSVAYDTAIGEVASGIEVTKGGCTLAGWVTKDGEPWDIKNSHVKSEQALYATWNIDVTFDANGHGTAPAVQTVKSGGKVTKPSDLTAEGYTFGGWYTDAACSDDKAYNFDTSVTEPLTLYAKWTAEKRTVTFDANGHGMAPAAQIVDYNSNAAKPADPTADGYTFGGWYKEAACTTAYDFAAPVKGDLKLYAKWTEAPAPAPTPTPDPVSEGVEMYRLYNPNSGEHFYTGNAGERDMLVGVGWSYEGVGWIAPTSSNTPVYRLYNANGGEHHYTMSAVERDMLVGVGWSYEDIGWYSDDEQRVPLYRDYNPNAFANNHNYTTSTAEHDMLMGVGWRPEGYAWYAIK